MARLIGIFDIGTQKGYKEGDADSGQIVLEYELIGKDKKSDGTNFTIAEFMSKGNHSNSTLMARFQGLTGVTLTSDGQKDKFGGFRYTLPADFTDKLYGALGIGCMVSVINKTAGTGVKIGSASLPPDGVEVGLGEKPFLKIDLESQDFPSDWLAAPLWIKNKINQSREFEASPIVEGQTPVGVSVNVNGSNASLNGKGSDGIREHESDIPF